MTKRITKASVIPLRHHDDARTSSAQDRLNLAERKAREAWAAGGSKRGRLAKEALAISADCTEAYMALATTSSDWQARVKLYRKAVDAGERVLGSDWKSKFAGSFWEEIETRPLMRAIASLANALRWEDELDEARDLYRELLMRNPTDQQEIRYELASVLLEAQEYSELDKLLAKYKDDRGAAIMYTKALYAFAKDGGSTEAEEALRLALEANHHVPLFLPGILETPTDKPATFLAGSEEEAIVYSWDNSFLWLDVPGAGKWLAQAIQKSDKYAKFDRALFEEIVEELKAE